MKPLLIIAILLALIFDPTLEVRAEESKCSSTGDPKKAEPHCELLKEPIFSLDSVAQNTLKKCMCFYQEAYAIVDLVKNYEMESTNLSREFEEKISVANAGYADRSQSIVSDMTKRAKEHHGAFANALEAKFHILRNHFDSYFQSINKLHQRGMNNLNVEITCWHSPESEVPALWSVSVSKRLLEQLQKNYLGSKEKIGFSRAIRKVHREAKNAEASSGEIQALTASKALSVGTPSTESTDDILHDPNNSMSPHYLTKGAATVAGGATGLVLAGSKAMPGAVGMGAAGLTEYFVYDKVDTTTLLGIGAGAIVAAAKGTVAGVIVSGAVGVLQYAGNEADALRHEYSEFSRSTILQNRSIRAKDLSKAWAKAKGYTCKIQ